MTHAEVNHHPTEDSPLPHRTMTPLVCILLYCYVFNDIDFLSAANVQHSHNIYLLKCRGLNLRKISISIYMLLYIISLSILCISKSMRQWDASCCNFMPNNPNTSVTYDYETLWYVYTAPRQYVASRHGFT